LVGGDATQDITTAISGGKIGGLIKVRDSEMPAFQASLDQLTGVLRDQVNIIHNTGTATSVPQVLKGARSGMAGTDSITGAGTVDIALVDRVTGNLVSKTTIDLSAPGLTLTNIMTQINGLDAVASLDANGVMSIRANNAAQGVAIASSSPAPAYINSGAQNYGFSHYFGLNDFFVTGNVLTGVSPGISSRLAVRPEIVNNMTRLANTNLDITQPIGARVVTSGGNTTLQSLAEIFSAKAIFAAAGKIPALQISLNDYATSIIQYTADEAGFLEQNYDHQTALYDLSLKGLDTLRGVNLQEEIMNLMQWQRQMKVCTQLIMTAQDMLQDLLKMNR
jgi:flagellar hook-associated protein 1 FlgK